MNWLDILLLALLAMSAFAGARLGVFWAAMAFGSLMIGWYFAGNVSGAATLAVETYTDSSTARAVVNAVVYVALLSVMLYAASRVLKVVKPLLSTVTLGTSSILDRVGGLLLGLVIGLMLIGAVILVGARLTYQVDLGAVDPGVPGSVEQRVAQGETVHEGLQELLSSSAVVWGLVQVATALPADTLGLAPLDFGDSLELLDEALD